MSLTKLTCPECSTTMRPKTPVAPGKKVRCPKCETVFVAKDDVDEVDEVDEVEEEAPRKKKAPAKAAAGRSKVKDEPKPKKKDEEAETYGYIREEEPEDEDNEAKKINYAPDESVRDLRGPAIVKLRNPANYLTLCGFIGAGGWLIFMLLMAIPFCFPIVEEKPPMDNFGRPIEDGKKPAPGGGKSTFHIWWNVDFYNGVINNWGGDKPGHPGIFWGIMFGFMLLFCYSGLVAFGAIKLVNMESRTWGFISAGMALLPHTAGLTFALAFGIQFALRQAEIDEDSINYLTIGIGVVLWLASVGLGVWTIIVANDPIVIEGYEYEPE